MSMVDCGAGSAFSDEMLGSVKGLDGFKDEIFLAIFAKKYQQPMLIGTSGSLAGS
jgi:hypothetical protein